MIPQQLMDYVKVYDNQIDSLSCKSIVEQLDLKEWTKHYYHNPMDNECKTYEDDLSVCESNTDDEINKIIWNAIRRYICEDFKEFNSWFGGWSGFTIARFNRYDPSTRMRLHCDHIHSMFDGQRQGIPTLTVLGSLNDNYEGGEFMMFGDMEIKLKPGSLILFPSNFMYPHEVMPIKSGVRYSFVSWVW